MSYPVNPKSDAAANVIACGLVAMLALVAVPAIWIATSGIAAALGAVPIYLAAWMLASVGIGTGLTLWQSFVAAFVLGFVRGFFKITSVKAER